MKDRSPFRANQLRMARAFHGLTQSELSEDIGCAQSMVAHVEAGSKDPPDAMVGALADRLEMERGFFYEESAVIFNEQECHFRRRKRTTKVARARMRSYGSFFASFIYYAENYIDFPDVNMPELRVKDDADVERAAAHCRLKWGLDLDRPIDYMTRVIENAGGIVTRLNMNDRDIDAFSRFGDRPVVLLNSSKQLTSRSRHDAAHELGHLVMHRDMITGTEDENDKTEDQADCFASFFLLPRASFFREYSRSSRVQWDEIYALKRRWKVSAKSIVYRAHRLGVIGEAEYTRAMKFYSKKGWNSGEPEEPDQEDPELVPMSLEALGMEFGHTLASIAKRLHWKEGLLRRVIGVELPPEPLPVEQEARVLPFPSKARLVNRNSQNR